LQIQLETAYNYVLIIADLLSYKVVQKIFGDAFCNCIKYWRISK